MEIKEEYINDGGLVAFIWGVIFLPPTLEYSLVSVAEESIAMIVPSAILVVILSGIPLFYGYKSIFTHNYIDKSYRAASSACLIWGAFTVVVFCLINAIVEPELFEESLGIGKFLLNLAVGSGLMVFWYLHHREYIYEKKRAERQRQTEQVVKPSSPTLPLRQPSYSVYYCDKCGFKQQYEDQILVKDMNGTPRSMVDVGHMCGNCMNVMKKI